MNDTPAMEIGAAQIADILRAGGVEPTIFGHPDTRITGVATLKDARPDQLSFLRGEKFLAAWRASRAGITLVTSRLLEAPKGAPLREPGERTVIAVPDADMALLVLLRAYAQMLPDDRPPVGVHECAAVDSTARLGQNVRVGPFCRVGPGAVIGDDSTLMSNVTINGRCVVGDRCIFHPGVVVGADGFGYRQTTEGHHVKIPHVGIVRIGDDVEIGANTCIDRATFGVTSIGAGTKIDNLVQIAHNCIVGAHCVICGDSSLAGSVTIGDYTMVGGSAGVADQRTVGSRVMLGARAGVMEDVPDGETWTGMPARPARHVLRTYAAVNRLPALIAELERVVAERRAEGDR